MNRNLLQRYAKHFRRRLGQNGVAAGANVGHVRFYGNGAVLFEVNPSPRFFQQIIAKARRNTVAD